MTAVLEAMRLHKAYGESVALRGVSLSVPSGEVFSLVGPNGAGKTTLVRCLTGTTAPSSGRAALFGSPPRSADPSRIGVLPQSFSPHDRLTAHEVVSYYAGLYDEPADPEAVLDAVGVLDAANTRYGRLSGGQRRRVCVASALVNEPAVLFLDEPTTGIDPAGRRAVWRLVADLAEGGTTVFLTTHYMEEAARLADRVGLLADGELVTVGPPGELIDRYGGESRLLVETDGPPPALPVDRFDIGRTEDGLVVRGVAPTDVAAVVEALDAHGVAYTAFRWAEPDLEDVFLRLTGAGAEAGRDGRRLVEGTVGP